MSNSAQNSLVLLFFIAMVLFIAYPIIAPKESLLATPADRMHLTITDTEEKNPAENEQEGQITRPIFTEK